MKISAAFCRTLLFTTLFLAASLTPVVGQETKRVYLSGHDKDDAVPWKFFCTSGAHSGYWTNLPVPSQWDVLGFGSLNYGRDPTNTWEESGLYEHEFKAPASWSGQRVFLVFDGSMTDTSAKLNGESAGAMHQGSFYQFKYEVTSLLKFGADNKLEVKVDKHSANRSVNAAERTSDFWIFGGIFRAVHLDVVPPQFIERIAIDARADGNFSVDVFLNGVTSADSVEAQIMSLDGKKVGAPFTGKISGAKLSLHTQITSPKTWTGEKPNLYRVEVRLKQDGQVVHQVRQQFGFRTMEVRLGDGLYLNGQKIILKGADRHSFWPDSGRTLDEKIHRLDIQTLKDMNMNAVRMSHYPPDEQFLDLCDELGLYVLDELCGWQKSYDTPVGSKLAEETVIHDVNHPSILFWDNGNEGGWNTELDHIYGDFDPQHRAVLHPWGPMSGLNTVHYLAYNNAKIAVTGSMDYSGSRKPRTNALDKYIYMPTEFSHGLFDGGAGAGLRDYWNIMSASPVCAGGFIWSFADEGIKRPTTGRMDVAGNAAPDGIVGPYREREGSFYTVKKIWMPIEVTRAADGTFTAENHFSFTDAGECKFIWQERRFYTPGDSAAGFKVVKEVVEKGPAIPPLGKGPFIMPAKISSNADAIALSIVDPNGRELWTYVWPVNQPENFSSTSAIAATAENFGGSNAAPVELKGKNLIAHVDGAGMLTGVTRNGKTFSLVNGPRAVGNDVKLDKVSWKLRADGCLQCDYTYTASGTQDYHGVAFDYPEKNVQSKRWLGDGPFRVWKNRLEGPVPGVWENKYNNTITGWRGWEYPEFKGCFANVHWMQLQTTEGLITAIPSRPDAFVQVLTPDFPADNIVMRAKISLPQAGLAFLNAIPPVGSKFQSPAASGPQGQPNNAEGEYSGSVSFYFGKLP